MHLRFNKQLQVLEYVHLRPSGQLVRLSANQNMWVAANHTHYEQHAASPRRLYPANAPSAPQLQALTAPRTLARLAPALPAFCPVELPPSAVHGIFPYRAAMDCDALPFPQVDLPNLNLGGRALVYDLGALSENDAERFRDNLFTPLCDAILDFVAEGLPAHKEAVMDQLEPIYSNSAAAVELRRPGTFLFVALDDSAKLAGLASLAHDASRNLLVVKDLGSNPASIMKHPGAPANAGFALFETLRLGTLRLFDDHTPALLAKNVLGGARQRYEDFGWEASTSLGGHIYYP